MTTEQDKLDREVTKLDWEITHLKRPFWKTPTGIAALLAGLVAFVGTGAQYLNSTVDKKLAEIERLETKAETLKLINQKTETERDLARLKDEQAQVSEEKTRVEEQYAALSKFFRDNPTIMNAQSLIETLRKARYPLAFQRNFKQIDDLNAKVSGKLTEDGSPVITVSVTGAAKTDKLNLKGYIVTVTDIQSGQELATRSTGPILVAGKKMPWGNVGVFEWKKAFILPKIEEPVMSRIFTDSQLAIAPAQ